MVNVWKTVTPERDEFQEFLELFDAGIAGKTMDMVRLRVKIGAKWDSFKGSTKKEYTDRLIRAGRVDGRVTKIVEVFNGTIENVEWLI